MGSRTYIEKGWLLERQFVLESDHVDYSARQRFGSIVRQRILLHTLQPEPARVWVRNTTLESGVAWTSLAAILLVVIFPFVGQIEKHDPEAWLRSMWLLIGVVLLGIACYFIFPRRIEFATFYSVAGVAVLSIGRRGKYRNEFDPFVADVRDSITGMTAPARPDENDRSG